MVGGSYNLHDPIPLSDGEDDGDDMCDALDLVEKTDKGYKLSLDVPNALFGSIIGRGGEIKKRIERETNTIISIPKKDQDGAIGE